jgi:hypothetical protein
MDQKSQPPSLTYWSDMEFLKFESHPIIPKQMELLSEDILISENHWSRLVEIEFKTGPDSFITPYLLTNVSLADLLDDPHSIFSMELNLFSLLT